VFYGDGYTYSDESLKEIELIPVKVCGSCGDDVVNNIQPVPANVEIFLKEDSEIVILKKDTKQNIIKCQSCQGITIQYGSVSTRHNVEFFDGSTTEDQVSHIVKDRRSKRSEFPKGTSGALIK